MNGHVQTIDISALRNLHGNFSNSQLLVINYLDNLTEIVSGFERCHIDHRKSSEFLVENSVRKKDYF